MSRIGFSFITYIYTNKHVDNHNIDMQIYKYLGFLNSTVLHGHLIILDTFSSQPFSSFIFTMRLIGRKIAQRDFYSHWKYQNDGIKAVINLHRHTMCQHWIGWRGGDGGWKSRTRFVFWANQHISFIQPVQQFLWIYSKSITPFYDNCESHP